MPHRHCWQGDPQGRQAHKCSTCCGCSKSLVTSESKKRHLMNLISDTISNFLYYDRKEDDELPVGAIEAMVKNGEITSDEIINEFIKNLKPNFGE